MDLVKLVENDMFRKYMDAEVLEVKKGYAKVRCAVKREFLNFHGTAHGAVIMAVADFAFALAVNSDGMKRSAVSIKIDFLKPAFGGNDIFAEAEVTGGGKRLVFCELRVYRGGEVIAKGDAIAYGKEKWESQV